MRKRTMFRAVCGAALMAVVGLAMAGRAAAQDRGTPWLGVTTQEITPDLRDGLDYRGNGVLVNRVVGDSPADRAGLRKGDVIVNFNSRPIDTPAELVEVVRAARVGQSVSLTVVREGARRSLTARLGAWPEEIGETPAAPEPPEPPAAPRAPKAPATPRSYTFEWDGDTFDLPGDAGQTMLRVIGRGRLGVQIQDLDADLAEALGVTGTKGVLVTSVVEDTPAARAGIKAGDVITAVADRAVADVAGLQRELREREGRVKLTLVRRGVKRTVEAELGERPAIVRLRSGRGDRTIEIPEIRARVLRDRALSDDARAELEAQMRELRQELRELRRQMEGMRKN